MPNPESRVPPTHPILSLRVGLPRTLGTEGASDPMERPWRTGIYKDPVDGRIRLGRTNLEGDGQADLRHHGGADKAVCVYPAAHYPFWRKSLEVDEFPYGAFGENFTVGEATEAEVCIGDVYEVGSARVQVTQPRQPCWRLARRWRIKDLAARVQENGYTGWYLRVLEEGMVEVEQSLVLIDRPHPEWTVQRANQVMHHLRDDREAAAELASLPSLSVSWRETLTRRARTGENPDPRRRLVGPNE